MIDVEREALTALSWGLNACGDDFAIHAFSSLKRDRVFVQECKGFDEKMGPRVEARIGGLTPAFYTRLGAAIRHMTAELDARPNTRRLLLVITDGKPNDLDHYEGRHGDRRQPHGCARSPPKRACGAWRCGGSERAGLGAAYLWYGWVFDCARSHKAHGRFARDLSPDHGWRMSDQTSVLDELPGDLMIWVLIVSELLVFGGGLLAFLGMRGDGPVGVLPRIRRISIGSPGA